MEQGQIQRLNPWLCYVALHLQHESVQLELNRAKNNLSRIKKRKALIHGQLIINSAAFVTRATIQGESRPWSCRLNLPTWYEDVLPKLPDHYFKDHFHISRSTFDYLCESLHERLIKQDTVMRKAIPVPKRIAAALFKLASCCEYRVVCELFGIGISTVCELVVEFCDSVVSLLWKKYVHFPQNRDELKEAACKFQSALGVPLAIGAIDGCHIPVSPPLEHARDYYNFKGWYSVVLFAVVDHNYKFTYINVGSPGKCNDGYIFGNSSLGKLISNGRLNEYKRNINGTEIATYLLADSAFPLSKHLIKPYPDNVDLPTDKSHFNLCLSGARRIVENAFGRLKARFRIVSKRMDVVMGNVNSIIIACCILNNMCEDLTDSFKGSWMFELLAESGNEREQPHDENLFFTDDGDAVREFLREYFWQNVPRRQ